MSDHRDPNYSEGRIFVSPIIGCSGSCIYCYANGSTRNEAYKNDRDIDYIVDKVISNLSFIHGKQGTIISIGAWGDIFPDKGELTQHSISWIQALLSIGNPVQIMSKFELDKDSIQKIRSSIKYDDQILYSSTVTSFNSWRDLEPNTCSPIDRLTTMQSFNECGIKTNLMIKPFIPSITDIDIDLFIENIIKYNVDYCVVGVLYWNKMIIDNIKTKIDISRILNKVHSVEDQTLDCSEDDLFNSYITQELDEFVNVLISHGIRAFKKSSCVNANMLKNQNTSGYYLDDPHNFCIKCGNCI